jgi:hypothetical protein
MAVIDLQGKVLMSIKTFAAFFAFVLFAVFVLRPAIVLIIKKRPRGKEVTQEFVVLILVGVLVMGFITELIGASIIHGALMLGIIVPDGPPLGSILVEKTELIVKEFFSAIVLYLRWLRNECACDSRLACLYHIGEHPFCDILCQVCGDSARFTVFQKVNATMQSIDHILPSNT